MIFDQNASLDSQGQLAINDALRTGMPSSALTAYARWFQLETWLRTLVHLELSARFGRSWIAHLDSKIANRRHANAVNDYMLSPDEESLLAYGDVGALFALIDQHWSLFEPFLVAKVRWDGWAHELRGIRNRPNREPSTY